MVDEQEVRHGVVGREDAQPPRAVEVGDDQPQRLAVGDRDARRVGDVPEATVSEVHVDAILSGGEFMRRAQPRRAVGQEAGPIEEMLARQIVGDVEVGQAVAVEVGERDVRRPVGAGDARKLRDVAERAVAVVVIEAIGADVADAKIGEAVVVEVTDRDALTESVLDNPRPFGHVFEATVAAISAQVIEMPEVILAGRPIGTLREIKIRPAVAVVIEHGGSAPAELVHVLPRNSRLMSVVKDQVETVVVALGGEAKSWRMPDDCPRGTGGRSDGR